MYCVNPLMPSDLFNLNLINLDRYSESFDIDYYLYYLRNHTEDCFFVSDTTRYPIGYIASKLECTIEKYMTDKGERSREVYKDHLSAISISPSYRRYGFGRMLMEILERNGELYNCLFVDLFVRETNLPAICFYEKLGFIKFRKIFKYYNDNENAYDMRKSLKHDKLKEFMQQGKDISVNEL